MINFYYLILLSIQYINNFISTGATRHIITYIFHIIYTVYYIGDQQEFV